MRSTKSSVMIRHLSPPTGRTIQPEPLEVAHGDVGDEDDECDDFDDKDLDGYDGISD